MSQLATTPSPPEARPKRRPRGQGFPKLRRDERSEEAKRLAAAILEVLAGARTPLEAAQGVGVSLPRYYLLEERALRGLVAACERRPRGRTVSGEREVEKLKRDLRRLENESARYQALLRAAQRTVGLSPPERKKPEPGKRRPRRSRLARALRAAEAIRSGGTSAEGSPSVKSAEC